MSDQNIDEICGALLSDFFNQPKGPPKTDFKCRLTALSPTSLKKFETEPDAFVMHYVLNHPRTPQTRAMAIGSAFDARIKAYLMVEIQGKPDIFEELYLSQVEKHNQAWAYTRSEELLQKYIASGAVTFLRRELEGCKDLQFEFAATKSLIYEDGFVVPLFGKPDLFFRNPEGLNVVFDWNTMGN